MFRALSDPRQLAVWWADEGNALVGHWEFDARLGGLWKNIGDHKAISTWETWGEIVEFEPPRVLALTWHERLDKPRPFGQTLVRYELEPIASGTRLRLTHSGFAAYREAFDDYSKGWHPVLKMLQDHFVTAN